MAMQTEPSRPGAVIPLGYPSDPDLVLTYDPDTARTTHDLRREGLVSGWVSTGFGLVQLLAPRTFLRAVGMPYPPWLIRAVGARDLALGLGLLASPASSAWRVTRFVNDVLDTGLIGAAAFANTTDRRRLAAFAALAAGVIALDAWTASSTRPPDMHAP